MPLSKPPQTLFPYQITGIDFLTSRKRALLADQVGLGKSRQSLEAAARCSYFSSASTHITLILCPAVARLNWVDEINKWVPGQNIIVVKSTKDLDNPPREVHYIASYDFLIDPTPRGTKKGKGGNPVITSKQAELLSHLKPDILICDEAHIINNWEAIRTRHLIKIVAPKCKRIWLLTGTPATRSAANLHPLFSLLEPGTHGKYSDFCKEFCNERPNPYAPGRVSYEGFKNTDKLRDIFSRLSLRRLKADVLPDLPPRIDQVIRFESSIDAQQKSDKLKAELARLLDDNDVIHQSVSANLSNLRIQIAEEKIPQTIALISSQIQPNTNTPAILFAWHKETVYALTSKLSDHGFRVRSVTGEHSDARRADSFREFNNNLIDILVCTIAATGIAINLTAAGYVFFHEQPWAPHLQEQAIGRAVRVGQKNTCVNIYFLVSVGTIDETVFSVLERKQRGIDKVISG